MLLWLGEIEWVACNIQGYKPTHHLGKATEQSEVTLGEEEQGPTLFTKTSQRPRETRGEWQGRELEDQP